MPSFSELVVEQAALEWFDALGYSTLNATEIAPDQPNSERQTYADVVLRDRLRNALEMINPDLPASAIEDAIAHITRAESPSLTENNRRFHQFLTDGVDVEYQHNGRTKYEKVWLLDFDDPNNNDWLAVNQFSVIEGKHNRRPDIVVFINGLPIAVIELKNPIEENATIKGAFNQLQTYKNDIPCLFPFNEILLVSDGTEARVGTLTADWEWFMPWRTIDGEYIAPQRTAEIVRDMWLTGFDAPCLHTLYVDKPMRGHGLMQAIARVNRVFKDKPGGLVVDYLGIADQLKEALKNYTEGDRHQTGIPAEVALDAMQEKYEIVRGIYHGFDYQKFFTGIPGERVSLIPEAMDFILGLENGRERYLKAVTELNRAFALVSSLDEAIALRDEVGFFQAIKVAIDKHTVSNHKSPEDLDAAVRQIVSKAVASEQVIDIFAAAGLNKPNIAIFSDDFLEEVRHLPQKNVALEVLKKLLNDEIKTRSRRNLVQSRSFREMLEKTVSRYQNRAISTAQVIAELIDLAQEIRKAQNRGENLGLSEDEVAFYDALEVNDSAVMELGDDTLKAIARELVQSVRRNVTIDWTVKESVRAKLRVIVRRLLKKYGYPPDKQEKATHTVLQQAELLCKDWAA